MNKKTDLLTSYEKFKTIFDTFVKHLPNMKKLFFVMLLMFAGRTVDAQVTDTAVKKLVIRCAPTIASLLNPPLIIVSLGKQEYRIDSLNNINPQSIQNINILKGATATNTYGEDGKNGVVQITLKEGQDRKMTKEFKKRAVKYTRPSK